MINSIDFRSEEDVEQWVINELVEAKRRYKQDLKRILKTKISYPKVVIKV